MARQSRFRQEAVETAPEQPTEVVAERVWSAHQEAIFDWFEDHCERIAQQPEHLVVRARAGTGKTTTIIEGVNRAPEQSILVCAFNKKIAEELNSRIDNVYAEAKTLHALGYAAIRKHWRGIPVATGSIRADSLTNMVCQKDTPKPILRLISQLHTKARDMHGRVLTYEALTLLALEFDLVPDEGWSEYSLEYVVARAQEAMSIAAHDDPSRDIGIDFADMIFLPLAHNLLSKDYEMVVVDECFPAGTLVQTLQGPLPIEQICVGTPLLTATGIGEVTKLFKRKAEKLAQVFLQDHASIVCTPNHPLLTQHGWVAACDLTPSHVMINPQLAWEISHDLRTVSSRISAKESQKIYPTFLRAVLRREMEYDPTRDASCYTQPESLGQIGKEDFEMVPNFKSGSGMASEERTTNAGLQSNVKRTDATIGEWDTQEDGAQTTNSRRKWLRADETRETTIALSSESEVEFSGRDEDTPRFGLANMLQDRSSNSDTDVSYRNRWPQSLQYRAATSGRKERSVSRTYRVDRVEIFQPADRGFAAERSFVHNISVSGHPSYVVGDIVAHNCQDLTLAQLEIAQRVCSGRICLVGDEFQAIYKFRGADSGSLDRLKHELAAGELPLQTTYRCCQAVVREAQRLVPDIMAGDTNPEGVVDSESYERLLDLALPGEFILSRLNAPLVKVTLQLLKRKKRARMAGRDIGAGIMAVLKKIGCSSYTTIEDALSKLRTWEVKSCTRFASYGQNDLIDRTHDQADMIRSLTEEAEDVPDLMNRIEWLFTDDQEAGQILCSSVHKAKGLEAERVYILLDTFYRRGPNHEEDNCLYVAKTRAKGHLTLIQGLK